MKYVALILRVFIIVIGFKLIHISGHNPNTIGFCAGVGFILIGVYLALQAIFGPKVMLCPFFESCRTGCVKK